jgi:hypothetical protein
MDRVARLPAAERSALFAETAARMRTTPAVATAIKSTRKKHQQISIYCTK